MGDDPYSYEALLTRRMLCTTNGRGKATIFKICDEKMAKAKHLYTPKTICIGPYQREKQTQRMIDNKEGYLINFLNRTPWSENGEHVEEGQNPMFDMYMQKMKQVGPLVRNKYYENLLLTPKEFSYMLLLDGAFILELFIKYNNEYIKLKEEMTDHTIRNLRRDLILVENQIPFKVLEELLRLFYRYKTLSGTPIPQPPLQFLASSFFQLKTPPFYCQPRDEIWHLLDLFYRSYVPMSFVLGAHPRQFTGHNNSRSVPSARDLKKFGLNLKKSSSRHILEVDVKRGDLTIPFMALGETRMSLYANIVAFEEIKDVPEKPIMSLCYFFKSLIRNEEDLMILVNCGIIENIGGTNGDLNEFFHNICMDTTLDSDKHLFMELFKDVQLYADTKWHRWWAVFKKEIVRGPWSLFTFLQSILGTAFVIERFYRAEEGSR